MRDTSGKDSKINPAQNKDRQGYRSNIPGRLAIVGIGPGDTNQLTQKARQAINESDVVVGYKTYIKLLTGLIGNKEIISSGMTQEAERARAAIKKAQEGKNVCIVSSGDPGIYGMAGLALELLKNKIDVEIIPGISAALSCASLLGAPIMHDFAVISLSDLLTDKRLIEKRILLAARGDFIIVLYNPKSRKRIDLFKSAVKILLKHRSRNTVVGIVRNAYRQGQNVKVTELKHLASVNNIDMFTTVIVGNSKTYVKDKFMITPRGYVF